MLAKHSAILSTILLATGLLRAQSGPTFEVASIRPNSRGGGTFVQALPGTLAMTNFSLRTLIVFAYGIQGYQISGEPSWISSQNYDIQAKAEGNTSVNQMEGPMLRALLADRFKLVFHRETKQLPVYELTLAKGGVKLQPTKEGSCTPYQTDAPPPPASATGAIQTFCGYPHLTSSGSNRALDGAGVSMEVLGTNLSRLELRRTVIDKTGLTGTFDVHLKWTIDPGAAPSDNLTGLSIYTALQEQMGLKLTSAQGPVEVLVIDHIEKPSDN
jgi:uncharacterized protein (TIGR03435 family)